MLKLALVLYVPHLCKPAVPGTERASREFGEHFSSISFGVFNKDPSKFDISFGSIKAKYLYFFSSVVAAATSNAFLNALDSFAAHDGTPAPLLPHSHFQVSFHTPSSRVLL